MIHNPKLYNNDSDTEPYAVAEEWVRPDDWIPIPEIASGEQVIYGLMAIFEENINYVAIRAAGNYTVDWGDGTIENIVSLAQAEHIYDYTTVGNDCSRGYRQTLIKVTPQAGQNITYIDFRRRHTALPAVVFNTRFLDIVINAPNVVGNNLYINSSASPSYLRMVERVSIRETGVITSCSEMFYYCTNLLQVDTFSVGGTNFPSMFLGCYKIQKLPMLNLSTATSMASFAIYCYSLIEVPLYNTSNVTSINNAFYLCYSLERIPNFNLEKANNLSTMFYQCYKLRGTINLNLPLASNLTQTFSNCIKIKNVNLTTSLSLTSLNGTFISCYKLENVTISNTSNVTNAGDLFSNCVNLQKLPIMDVLKVQQANSMFRYCEQFTDFSQYTFRDLVSTYYMFANCFNVKKLPNINSTAITNSTSMLTTCYSLTDASNILVKGILVSTFEGCYTLQKIAPIDCTGVTSLQQTFYNCYLLEEIELTNCDSIAGTNCTYYTFNQCLLLRKLRAQGLKVTFSVANCSLDATALNELFTSLGTPATTQIVTVKGNPGASTCDTSIATAKNWTVVII